MTITRRGLLIGLPLFVAGCQTSNDFANYGPVKDGPYELKRIPLDKFKPDLRRQEVAYETTEKPGTVVVDTPAKRLYYVLGNGRAIRYGVGVGKEGRQLRGNAYVGRKAEWPTWTPTQNMINRDARNRQYAGGLPGGPSNPLGARAMYLYRDGHDIMFRIHGTNQPWSIGQAMSSGCIRMMNHDVIDLYNRVDVGAKVVVHQA
ncbi:L,D-transpeptidase [Rhizobium halophytocola]|uniref:Lipoprotein-anchoring transpeptidase ErfK/SrfK n=1 Tax=Rhizobium halophytocola TaxID=735519 RepID=A0ABS4E3D9_9HYPH|nr:L,D-transpeptidase [Rhizobium halophytocola]MBP1852455.1 lipoprotein-anchoring transpeptidase ErfK/SrfK [Rhizobium halophytocola]